MKESYMTIKNITTSQFLIAALLMSHSSVCSMEKKNICRAIIPHVDFNVKKLTEEYKLKELTEEYKAYNAQQYNKSNILIALPEISALFVSQINPLKDGIKTALSLRRTCKHFYMLPLEYFGKAYPHHTKTEKNEVLSKLLSNVWNSGSEKYRNTRCGSLILIYAGADNDANKDHSLLALAIRYSDKKMITLLFKNGVSPHQKNKNGDPDFFYIRTIKIAKTFIANNVNLNMEGSSEYGPYLLWSLISHGIFPSELVEFYLNHHVDAKKIEPSDGYCILHYIVGAATSTVRCAGKYAIDYYIKVCALLLKAVPEMVDLLNNRGETPIDWARDIMAEYKDNYNYNHVYKLNKQFIALFEKQKLINEIKKSSHRTDLSRE